MSETTLLRQNAIRNHASVGATPPHGPVKTGELPLVHVKHPPGGPQVQEGQQKPVTILPPRDAESAVKTGGLPMVKVKMTDGKAKLDDGQDNSQVVIKDNRQTVAAGNLPMLQIKMENGRPVQTVPNVQAGPPQIPGAAPALSAPRVAQSLSSQQVTRIAAPRAALTAPPLPEVPELTTDQLMLCRHVVDKYLAELVAAASNETTDPSEAAKLAVATLATIDDALVAIVVRAEAAALAVAAQSFVAPAPVSNAYVNPRPTTGGHFSPAALAPPVPRNTGYVAQRPGSRTNVAGVRTQGNSSLAPRGVQRSAQSGPPLPPVVVKMDGNRPVLQQTPPPVDPAISEPTEGVDVPNDSQG